jgi:hypothetical protein
MKIIQKFLFRQMFLEELHKAKLVPNMNKNMVDYRHLLIPVTHVKLKRRLDASKRVYRRV